jgi:NADPH:quinone reductase-like Zn-dependent oxidoreductase
VNSACSCSSFQIRTRVPVSLPHARLGVEGTGVVDALGPGGTGLETGGPVILVAVPDASVRGSYAEYTTVPASRVVARPAGLGITEAASVWVGYSTAYGALVEKAGMRPGDHVLVTAAFGAVGRAATEIASQTGAVPIAVTRHMAKRDDLLAVGAAAVVATDEANVAEAVRRYTGGTGADIVLDLVRGPASRISCGRPVPARHWSSRASWTRSPRPSRPALPSRSSATRASSTPWIPWW